MKANVYLDTSILIALLFGELSQLDQQRQPNVQRWFEIARNTPNLTLFISVYTLQEIVTFVYENYPESTAAEVLRLAILLLFQHKLVLLPLLNRSDSLIYRRRISAIDRSDMPHLILAVKHSCNYLLTYDEHFANVAELKAITPEAFEWGF